MSTDVFTLQEHAITASYIREYHRSTVDAGNSRLQLAVKQYTPIDNQDPQPGDLTILGAHANGFPKELYEPLWDELYYRLKKINVRIRGIWIMDTAWQGYSGVLNEHRLGNDPNWNDNARDLFLLVNHFAPQMATPIIGIGHSMGGHALTTLALMHPRLFTTLVLIDPIFARAQSRGNTAPAKASTSRRDIWPSRKAATAAFSKSKFYQSWDPRVLERWIDHGLRDLPTAIHSLPSSSPEDGGEGPPVTLRTTKHQEVASFLRLNPSPGSPNPLTHPDVDPTSTQPIYRAEPMSTFHRLPELRPSVLYIFGSKSDVSMPLMRADKMAVTGVGVGGSGGATKGRVVEVLVDTGHLVPMEKVGETADAAAEWIGSELGRWREGEEQIRRAVEAVPVEKRAVMAEEFVRVLKGEGPQPGKNGAKL